MNVQTTPSPDLVFDMLFSYQKSAALTAAIDLDVFTAIDRGARTPAAIANATAASERGIRSLCNFLTVHGLLEKTDGAYGLTLATAAFLSKQSPMYLGTTARFLGRSEMKQNFEVLTDAVRRGGVDARTDIIQGERPLWVEFARSMMPMMVPAAQMIAEQLAQAGAEPTRVLDIAASHGLFGITLAQRNPRAEITAVDWPSVLAVAAENAAAMGVSDRYHLLPGSAFTVEFGEGFDVVLVTNFLHHFDAPTNSSFLRKVNSALKPGGRIVVLEFVPNPDRVSPPIPAGFSLTMLAETVGGDAYTFAELRTLLEGAGFSDVVSHQLPTPQTVLIARR